MAEITDDVEVRVASEAAQQFVDTYYSAINSPRGREHVTDFYVKPSDTLKVDLNFNGAVLPEPAAVQELFTKQVQKCHYDVQAFDCHVVNKNYSIGMPPNLTGNLGDGRKMSIMVIINGVAKYFIETANQAEQRSFVDNIVLVPNWDSLGVKGDKRAKKWLIQSQTFRVVV